MISASHTVPSSELINFTYGHTVILTPQCGLYENN